MASAIFLSVRSDSKASLNLLDCNTCCACSCGDLCLLGVSPSAVVRSGELLQRSRE